MNMKKTVRKMSAILAGATMIGATVVGAMAYDLSDYPSPFIKDGFFTGKIVVGEKALPADIIGATDIASALQAESVTPVTTTGTGPSEEVVGGYLFSESKDLVMGSGLNAINSAVDDTEMPDMLGHKSVKDNDNKALEYDQEIALTTGTVIGAEVKSTYDLDDSYTEPVLYYDLAVGTSFYTATISFDDDFNAEDFTESQSIELFGQMYTFDPNNLNTDDVLTLFGTESEVYVAKGESATVKYDGVDYTIEVLGGNTDANPATVILTVGSKTKTVSEGDSEDFDGTLPIYVKDVFIDNTIAAGANVAVQLFVGSNKVELNVDGTVSVNDVDLDDVVVTETPSGDWGAVTDIVFTVTPGDADPEVEYILNGESYVDPVFGSFKFYLAEQKDFMKGKEALNIVRSGDLVSVDFTPLGGEAYNLEVADTGVLADDLVIGAGDLEDLAKNAIFVYNDDNDADAVVTHVLQVTKIENDAQDVTDADFKITVKDLTFDKTYLVTDCDTISNDILLYPAVDGASAGVDSITFTADADCEITVDGAAADAEDILYTAAGAKVDINPQGAADYTLVDFIITEDYQDDTDTLVFASDIVVFNVTAAYDSTDGYQLTYNDNTAPANTSLTELGDDNDVEYYLSEFGTYAVYDNNDDSYVNLYVPATEVHYDMWLSPVASTVVVSGSPDGTSYTINPMPPGSTVLDKDAMSLIGKTPLIVVGGPFVNTVAADLMGNPTTAQINTMFTAGLGKIKLYSDKNALLVAGYSAQDTLGAAYVLAEHSKYVLDGSEVEVVVPSLSSITVRTPTSN
jgi:hypothetical protein